MKVLGAYSAPLSSIWANERKVRRGKAVKRLQRRGFDDPPSPSALGPQLGSISPEHSDPHLGQALQI
eukprot:363257-Chlamydomonas_euryale.AAC.6